MYSNLQDFIKHLEKNKQLACIKTEVNPELEISEIYDRVVKQQGKALLFENVHGSKMPLLINAFGTYERMKMALGTDDLNKIQNRIESLVKIRPPKGFGEALKTLNTVKDIFKFPPKKVRKARCQEIIKKENASLDELPIIKCWPEDGGKFITLGQVITRSIKSGNQNVGMYRLQMFDDKTLGFHVHIHHTGAAHYHEYKEQGKKMPVSIALGGDPACIYSATAPLPPEIDEYLFAGFLRNKNINIVKCITNDLYVPADAEIVIEGYVDPSEPLHLEGPFGDHTGYYSLADMYPVLHVTAITHCKNPVYPTTVVGRPVQEDCYLGWATERIFLPLIKMLFPEVVDYHLPFWGIFHNVMFVKIKKYYPFQAQRLMQGIWGTGQMTFTKMIFVFDSDIDLTDLHSVIKAILKNCDFEKHVTFSEGALDVLDHSAQQPIYGSKIGFDCTTKLKEENVITQNRSENNIHVIAVDKKNAFDGRKAVTDAIQKEGHPFVIAVDKNININDHFEVLFRLGNNVDPKRDSVQFNHCIGFDATTKWAVEGFTREWPKDIEMDVATKKLVDQKWSSYGIS